MKKTAFGLAVVFGLVAGLVACQDQTVVAPEDGVLSPDQLELAAKKPPKPDPVPNTKEVHFVAAPGQSAPMFVQFDPKDWDVNDYDDQEVGLTVYNQSFEANLAKTFGSAAGESGSPSDPPDNGVYGLCIYDPIDTPADVIIALAEELNGDRVDPWEPDPYVFPHNILEVDRTTVNTGQGSEENRIQFGYSSDLPDDPSAQEDHVFSVWSKKNKRWEPGTLMIRVGGLLRMGDFGQPAVSWVEDQVEESFTFFGGTVSVLWWNGGRPKPRLECPLHVDESITVSVKK
jgi:hypothetical protein